MTAPTDWADEARELTRKFLWSAFGMTRLRSEEAVDERTHIRERNIAEKALRAAAARGAEECAERMFGRRGQDIQTGTDAWDACRAIAARYRGEA